MNEQAVAQVQQARGEIEYIPFGADSKIKLTVKIIRDMVAIPTRTGKLPEDRECIKFMMLCRARKLNPFEGDCFLQGYDGGDGPQFSLITAHQAFLKRAEVNAEYDGMTSGVIVKDENDSILEREGDFLYPGDTLLGGWAKVFFKARKVPTYRRLNLATFNQGFGRWKKDPAGMIVKCAEADALRSSFPTMLGGLYSETEMPQVIDVQSTAKRPNFGAIASPESIKTPQEPPQAAATPGAQEQTTSAPNASPAPASEAPQGNSATAEESDDIPMGNAGEFKPRDNESPELTNLRYAMHQQGVSEEQVMAYCRRNKVAKDEQKQLGELSSAKHKSLAAAFNNIVAEIKKEK